MTFQALPPIPAYVMAAPQQLDVGRASGFALIVAAAIAGPGIAPASDYLHGAHAVATHAAEAQKSRVWPSVRSPPAGRALLGAQLISAPQKFDASLPPLLVAPRPAGATPRVAAYLVAAPQAVDLTLQPFADAPQPAGATPAVPGYQIAGPQFYDATLQPSVNTPLPGPLTGPVRAFVAASSPTVDFTLQPFYDAPQTAQGWIVTVVAAGPDITEYPLIQGFRTATAVQGLVAGKLGAFVGTPPQADLTQQPSYDAPRPLGWAPRASATVTAAPQAYDSTQAPFYDSPRPAGATPRIGAFVNAAPIDPTQRIGQYWEPLTGTLPNIGPVPPLVSSAPQVYDWTLQAFFDAPQPSGWTLRIPQFVLSAPQSYDATLQPFYSAPVPSASAARILQFVWSSASAFDLTQQPPLYVAPPSGVLRGPVPRLVVSSPQQFDYTVSVSVFEPLAAQFAYRVRAPQLLVLDDYGKRVTLGAYGVRIQLDE